MAVTGAGAATPATSGSARLGNVSVLLAALAAIPADRVAAARGMLEGRFVVVHETGASLSSWVRMLEGEKAERVLVAMVGEGGISLVAVLAMVSWPEVDALVHGDARGGALVMLRREAVLASARAAVARGEQDPFVWLRSIDAERVDAVELGLAGASAEAC